MEFNKEQTKITKGVAILFMLLLHLFCTREYKGLFTPILMIGNAPLVYYIALFGDMCVAMYCFCSGYGLMIGYKNNKEIYLKKNLIRILKLYINFWIILFLFVVILGPVMGNGNIYPGNLKTFLLNFTAIDTSYNGAWWFLTTYIILVILSPCINKIILKYNSILIIVISFMIYFIAYIQRIQVPIVSDSQVVNYILRQAALLGTSQFSYIIGAIFAHKKIYSKIYEVFNQLKFKNIIAISLIIFMIIAHGIVQTLFVAVFTGISFIVLFNLIDKPKWIDVILSHISKHSTNMWLTHMFFYMIYFKKLIYLPKYPIFIFIWLVVICVATSCIINFVYKFFINIIDLKLVNRMNNVVTFKVNN